MAGFSGHLFGQIVEELEKQVAVLLRAKNYDEAIEVAQKVVEIRKTGADENPDAYAESLNILGFVFGKTFFSLFG